MSTSPARLTPIRHMAEHPSPRLIDENRHVSLQSVPELVKSGFTVPIRYNSRSR